MPAVVTTVTPIPELAHADVPPLPSESNIAVGKQPEPRRALISVLVHALVDLLSFVVIAVLPTIKHAYGLSDERASYLVAVGAACSGLIQPAAAWLGDRWDRRAVTIGGVVVAGIAVGLIGWTDNYAVLLLLQALASAGIGAFHPGAAAQVGESVRASRRTLWLSVFFLAGMFGGMMGNTQSPLFVKAFGLPALLWALVPAAIGSVALLWSIEKRSVGHADAHASHRSLSAEQRSERWTAVGLLYAGNVLRFAVDGALFILIPIWMEKFTLRLADRESMSDELSNTASLFNGGLQAAKQLGMGAGAVLLGLMLAQRFERLALVVVPLLGAAMLVVLSREPNSIELAFLLLVIAGVGYGSLVPSSISLAQRLLPHRTGLASGLMLGGAWGVGSLGAVAAERAATAIDLRAAFLLAASFLVAASVLSACLTGRVLRSIAD